MNVMNAPVGMGDVSIPQERLKFLQKLATDPN